MEGLTTPMYLTVHNNNFTLYKLAKRVLTKICKRIFACHKPPPSIKKLSPAPAAHACTYARNAEC